MENFKIGGKVVFSKNIIEHINYFGYYLKGLGLFDIHTIDYVGDEYVIVDGKIFTKEYFRLIEKINMNTFKIGDKVEKERVIKAANTSKEAYDLLKELYPDYFEDEKYLNLKDYRYGDIIGDRISGKYIDKGYYLMGNLNWEIITDQDGSKVLLPTKK